jgi:hypothetical protein
MIIAVFMIIAVEFCARPVGTCIAYFSKRVIMRNVLIFACLAGIAAAVTIYFTSEDSGKVGERLADEAQDYFSEMA